MYIVEIKNELKKGDLCEFLKKKLIYKNIDLQMDFIYVLKKIDNIEDLLKIKEVFNSMNIKKQHNSKYETHLFIELVYSNIYYSWLKGSHDEDFIQVCLDICKDLYSNGNVIHKMLKSVKFKNNTLEQKRNSILKKG